MTPNCSELEITLEPAGLHRGTSTDALLEGDAPEPDHPSTTALPGAAPTCRQILITLLFGTADDRTAAQRSLLFLGFQINSPVFRTIMQQEGMKSSRGPQFAVEIAPEAGRVLLPSRTRADFERTDLPKPTQSIAGARP